ncbi:sigma-70 family RNA polymerase sigma factor [Paenibacillus pini]|uniref:RNA polymerase sigma factor n=1 Tax=Paenibacillus pini JCM 16418 TaxID=1236976 RepID=W7YEE0_9BACL|nr:sigma-70 family RNA polymerase sigma factor [Paenibacillus pini]GAF09295.1 RNA polymerase [Paenibacillus pini JCM 16418]
MNHSSDFKRLIELSLAGSRDAFGELYEATIKDVYKTVYYLIREPSDVEDVIQEVYVQVYRSLDKYDVNRAFRPWLMGVVMRQIQAFRRHKWSHVRIIKKAEQMNSAMVPDLANDVVDKISNHILLAHVDRLPYKLKIVIILHYLKMRRKQKTSIMISGKVEDIHGSRS